VRVGEQLKTRGKEFPKISCIHFKVVGAPAMGAFIIYISLKQVSGAQPL